MEKLYNKKEGVVNVATLFIMLNNLKIRTLMERPCKNNIMTYNIIVATKVTK